MKLRTRKLLNGKYVGEYKRNWYSKWGYIKLYPGNGYTCFWLDDTPEQAYTRIADYVSRKYGK